MSDIYTLGIDVGSTASKCIILKNGCEIVSKSLIGVGAGTSGPERAIKQVLDGCGMKKEDMAYTLATGYGRNSLMGLADQQMSELSCHAKGATFLFPDVHTVIDIGGQDVKILHIENGAMVNFAMNDKCAAGTGRFLDVMARVLEVRVDDLDKLGALSTKDVAISSTCTVFAESEVISLISKNKKIADIIHGLNKSVAIKTKALASKAVGADGVMMTGGVANNKSVVTELEKQLNTKIFISDKPEFCGAIGAGLFAVDSDR